MAEVKKKSLSEKIRAATENALGSAGKMIPDAPSVSFPEMKSQKQPLVDMSGMKRNIDAWKPASAEAAPAPAASPEAYISPEDQMTADYLAESQTLDGPEENKVAAESVPEPNAFKAFFEKWKSVPVSLRPEDKKTFDSKMAALDQKMLEAEQNYSNQQNKLAWAEAAEQLGQAVVQFMAARDAAKNNWSVGGIAFDKNNWQAKMDRALREFDSRKDTISKQQNLVSREADKEESKAERSGRAEQSILARDFFTTQAKIQAEAKRDAAGAKSIADKTMQAKEKARMYTANYEAAEDAANKLEAGEYGNDKEKQKLKDEIVDALRKNGHIGTSKALGKGGEAEVQKTGGILGFWQSDDYSKMKQFISANKKRGIKSVYEGYGVPVPNDVNEALLGEDKPAVEPNQQSQVPSPPGNNGLGPDEVIRDTPDGRKAIFNSKSKKFIRYQ